MLTAKLRFLLIAALSLVCVGMLTTCGEESEPDTSVAPLEPKTVERVEQRPAMPNIYIDQTITPVSAGNRRELYADLLNICKDEGVSIKALSENERNRLGTIRLQRWLDETRTAYRLEAWDYQLAEPQQQPHCHFELVSSGRHVLIEEAGIRSVLLDNNQLYESERLTNIQTSLLLRTPARQDTNATDQLRKVVEQPCVEATIDEAALCTWAGGIEWGFEPRSDTIDSVMDAQDHQLFRSIILRQEPAGNALDKIRTVTFNIGDSLDEAAMQPGPATALPARQP
ncbi:MAG TPA: hypothetical protein DCQ49_14445 [Methylophaga sp.]|jgi:hypothetical protein|uniref:hypothetical protein n=1 Tax=unclassified Methylophaga TaxID=2629249 RepID=UPI000C97C352|nr:MULTISPECIES: hypothetical protein [unclassified Methylophaga]MAK67810.1 hypothetical protein [Methylophaga sp.]MBN45880.1 hypothetical protein [Methylophaga sp.]HAO26253.1 hypothetical protein [Methylophaga sp.]HCD04988.1 hypothetical protein [Methylophaga sp.]|tara:strand:- start:22878 stop:23729 length:852 start_codon:yes stop_codon:yes gene_type:complete